jgi:hypothetical protein
MRSRFRRFVPHVYSLAFALMVAGTYLSTHICGSPFGT